MEVEELYSLFDKKFEGITLPYLKKILPANKFSEPIWYILKNFHWRRFRAAFPIILAEKYGAPLEIMLRIGAASELIFAIALVQDDIIDGDAKRTNIDTAHEVYGLQRVMASIDYVYAYVNKILVELEKFNIPTELLEKLKVNFIDSQKKLYESFILEKLNGGNVSITKEELFEIYIKKTITGINALHCAALLCKNVPNNFAKDILEYSKFLGIAGQIKNDIYDLVSWRKYPDARGYSDLRNGYMTYAIRKLLDVATKNEQESIERILKSGKDADKILKLMEKYNIIEECIKDCKMFGEKAIILVKGKYPEIEEILLAWVEGNRRFTKL